jgi:hypothetical protein
MHLWGRAAACAAPCSGPLGASPPSPLLLLFLLLLLLLRPDQNAPSSCFCLRDE